MEEIPEHIQKIKDKHSGEDGKEKGEIDFEFWHFVAIYLFRFSEKEFFEETTMRRLFSLTEQYQKFHEK